MNQASHPEPAEQPALRAVPPVELDDRRTQVSALLQSAVGEGRLSFEGYCDRVRAAYAATTSAELEATVHDLSAVQRPAVSEARERIFNIFGDTKRIGAWRIADKTLMMTVFGDIVLDLRSAYLHPGDIEINGLSWFGDLRIIVPEGVEATVSGFAVFGDQSCELSGTAVPNAPRVRVRWFSMFGDADVTSEHSRKRWVRKLTRRS